MYMDEIQYTYKPCKLLLMKYIQKNNILLENLKLKMVYMINRNTKLKTCFYEFCVNQVNINF